MAHLAINTPLGPLTLFEEAGALVAIEFGRGGGCDSEGTTSPLLARAKAQLDAYFAGAAIAFDLPLKPRGTTFQQRVWRRLGRIPHGRVASYGALAAELGSGARAVAQACARNPIPIVVPCHRVVAARGLGGYSGGDGLATKRALLALEGVAVGRGDRG